MDLRITVLLVFAVMFVCTEAPSPCSSKITSKRPEFCDSHTGRRELDSLLARLLIGDLKNEVEDRNTEIDKKDMEEKTDTRNYDGEVQEETVRLLELLLDLEGVQETKK